MTNWGISTLVLECWVDEQGGTWITEQRIAEYYKHCNSSLTYSQQTDLPQNIKKVGSKTVYKEKTCFCMLMLIQNWAGTILTLQSRFCSTEFFLLKHLKESLHQSFYITINKWKQICKKTKQMAQTTHV